MCDIMHHLLRNLHDGISEELSSLTVQYLAVLGQHFAENDVMWHWKSREQVESEDSENSDSEAMDDDEEPSQKTTALRYLVLELAATLKRNTEAKNSTLIPRSAALKLITALCTTLPRTELEPCLEAIMHPLIHLTDPSITAPPTADDAFKEAYAELVAGATELMDLLQKKLGTVEFVRVLQAAKGKIAEHRDERRRKRRIEAVAQPEVAERRKTRKKEKVKVKKKERITTFRSRRRGW
jgi:U3 small nucleolar RNA-associated protein 20